MAFDANKCLKFTCLEAITTISIGVSQNDGSHYQFSKDGSTWVDDTITLEVNEVAYCKGSAYPGNKYFGRSFTFLGDGQITLSGSIMSLVDDGAGSATTINQAGGFFQLFANNHTILSFEPTLLSATTLAENCYAEMFKENDKITFLPAGGLPALNLAARCYKEMFAGCDSLVLIPENFLPATTLKDTCYEGMFKNCGSLTSVKNLFPETFGSSSAESAFKEMFYKCSILRDVWVAFHEWPQMVNWLKETAYSGTFWAPADLEEIHGPDNIPENWQFNYYFPNLHNCLRFVCSKDDVTISHSMYEFSKNGVDWFSGSITLQPGQFAYCKGTRYPATAISTYESFVMTGSGEIELEGSIMSLVSDGEGDIDTITQDNGFNATFKNCHQITKINPGLLPAKNLTTRCYLYLFQSCQGITQLPVKLFSAKKLATASYQQMFQGCPNLMEVPFGLFESEVTLAKNCFAGMFWSCGSIKRLPAGILPYKNLAGACYYQMFRNCASLESIAPGLLPATTLQTDCYREMFMYCPSLKKVPQGVLITTSLPGNSLTRAFYGCSSLNEIHVAFTSWTSATSEWVYGVSPTGRFYGPEGLPTTTTGVNAIPSGWVVNPAEIATCLRFTPLEDNCTISIPVSKIDSSHYYFSKDGRTWTPDTITLGLGEFAYCKGTNYPSANSGSSSTFSISKPVEISGNIMSLVDDGMGELDSIPSSRQYAFQALFEGQPVVKIPSNFFPAKNLSPYCYSRVFAGTQISELPPNTFPSVIENSANSAFEQTFAECEALTKIPRGAIPRTSLGEYHYAYCFSRCVNLTTIEAGAFASNIPLSTGCFKSMFTGCSSLETLPLNLLTSKNLAEECYQSMFAQCTSLKNSPYLLAEIIPDRAYDGLFMRCSSLEKIFVKFKHWEETFIGECSGWVAGVSDHGTFYAPQTLQKIYDDGHIPPGWNFNEP